MPNQSEYGPPVTYDSGGSWWDSVTGVLGDVVEAGRNVLDGYIDFENWQWEREQNERAFEAWASQWDDPGSSDTATQPLNRPIVAGLTAQTLLIIAAVGVGVYLLARA